MVGKQFPPQRQRQGENVLRNRVAPATDVADVNPARPTRRQVNALGACRAHRDQPQDGRQVLTTQEYPVGNGNRRAFQPGLHFFRAARRIFDPLVLEGWPTDRSREEAAVEIDNPLHHHSPSRLLKVVAANPPFLTVREEGGTSVRYFAMLMMVAWVNSSSPSSPNSAPMPDCFAPINGMSGPTSRCLFTQTALSVKRLVSNARRRSFGAACQ